MDAVPQPHARRHRVRYDDQNHFRSLTCSCFGRQPFLNSDRTRAWLVDAIGRARGRHGFKLTAFVIMPEHFHLLLYRTHQQDRIASILTTIKQSVSRRAIEWVKTNAPQFIPRMTDRQPNGKCSIRFWQRGGGYDRNLWTPDHISESIDYIHCNPVKRGLCAQPWEWPWSSALAYRTREPTPISIDFETLDMIR